MELARKLAREMDAHRTVSVSRVYVPNEYSVWLSPSDRERYEGVEHEVIDELCAYLLEHARREDLILASPPHISFHTDERLSLGEFGIQARLVRADEEQEPAAAAPAPRAAPGSRRARGARPDDDLQLLSARSRTGRRRTRAAHAAARAARRRRAAPARPPGGGTIGRSRDCDVVLDDAGVSRRHAELRPGPDGWTVADLRLDQRRTRQRRAGARRATAAVRGSRRAGLDGGRLRSLMNTLAPVSVALKFGFLAVMYLFLLWIARSARRDLRRSATPGESSAGHADADRSRRTPPACTRPRRSAPRAPRTRRRAW